MKTKFILIEVPEEFEKDLNSIRTLKALEGFETVGIKRTL
jgi:hypothetical protein